MKKEKKTEERKNVWEMLLWILWEMLLWILILSISMFILVYFSGITGFIPSIKIFLC
jgi:uncharacterized membrane-anchored protein